MIKTRIAKIISPTTIILAAGTLQGVQEGMEFVIYELTEPILDPETKEDLGQLELHKGRVKVINAQEKIAQAAALPRGRYQPSIFDRFLFMPSWDRDEPAPLRIEEGSTATMTKTTDMTVRVGDLVRSLD